MLEPAIANLSLDYKQSPIVGQLADQLMNSLRMESLAAPDGLALIQKMLGFAAEAEQRLTEQRRRINYLESLSMTDELTGLANRRGLEDFIRRTLASAKRHSEYGIVAYIDLDGFKAVNDTFGHSAGDKMLRHVAALLVGNVRASDLVARLGGDEFVVVLVRSGVRDGTRHAERLRAILNRARVVFGNTSLPIRASVGIEPYTPDSSAPTLIHRADKAMYRQKRQGAA